SGLRGFTELRKKLDTEADGIFAPRASKDRTFYQALDRFEQARRTIRDRELKAVQWKDLNGKIDDLARELEELMARRHDNAAEHARLSRLRRVAPQIALVDEDLRQLADLGTLPDVAIGFSVELEEKLRLRKSALLMMERATKDEESARTNHSSIQFDD